jgi:hypothetical protein
MTRTLLLFAIAACGTTPLPPGAVCKATADCESNLMCLDVAQFAGSACTTVGKSCSTSCTTDASCASLGSNFKCFATCTAGAMACEMVAN